MHCISLVLSHLLQGLISLCPQSSLLHQSSPSSWLSLQVYVLLWRTLCLFTLIIYNAHVTFGDQCCWCDHFCCPSHSFQFSCGHIWSYLHVNSKDTRVLGVVLPQLNLVGPLQLQFGRSGPVTKVSFRGVRKLFPLAITEVDEFEGVGWTCDQDCKLWPIDKGSMLSWLVGGPHLACVVEFPSNTLISMSDLESIAIGMTLCSWMFKKVNICKFKQHMPFYFVVLWYLGTYECYSSTTGTTPFNGLVIFLFFDLILSFRLQTMRRFSTRTHLSHTLHIFTKHVYRNY